MIGIFDSGVGGLASLQELRKISESADIVYLADRKNAPYGTKSREELVSLVNSDIEALIAHGCEQVLIACCTASTVYGELSPRARCVATPIISPAAFAAAKITARGNIGVIATEATVRSGAFKREIMRHAPVCRVTEIAAQPLVALVESGARDGALSCEGRKLLGRVLAPLCEAEIDTLILGCTHFSHLDKEIRSILGNTVTTVLPSREGVAELIRKSGSRALSGSGATVYIST